jgi:hypothetical protein
MILVRFPSTKYLANEVSMPFLIRPARRLPACCPVTYHCGDFEGHGTVWNLSLTGWRFSGSLPLLIGDVCSLTVTLPPYQLVYVAAGMVCPSTSRQGVRCFSIALRIVSNFRMQAVEKINGSDI